MFPVIVLYLLYLLVDLCYLWSKGLLCAKSGQVVLAGDPKQLGPIVRSSLAKKYGMGNYRHTQHMFFPAYNTEVWINATFVSSLKSYPPILSVYIWSVWT